MTQKNNYSNQDTINFLEKFLKQWKYILLSLVVFITLAVLYLRYATYQYEAVATIKHKDNSNAENPNRLNDMQYNGIFMRNSNLIDDEIEVLQSRLLIDKIIKD